MTVSNQLLAPQVRAIVCRAGVALAIFLWLNAPCISAGPFAYLGPANFEVLNSAGTRVIGHSHYDISRSTDDLLIGRGEADFDDGERDVEYDQLQLLPNRPPAMLSLDHRFYNADGSMQRVISADFRSGRVSCIRYNKGVAQTNSVTLKFPPNSYGGSAVVLPLQEDLARGVAPPLKLQALNCVPGPRLIAVEATISKPSHWRHYPGQVVEVDVKPDLGWLNAFLAPFVPELRAWFDPSHKWQLVGAQFSRFYRGPRVMLVRIRARDQTRGDLAPE